MKFETYLPIDLLKPFIKVFMIIESDVGMENRLVPDTSLVMALRLKGFVTDTTGEQGKLIPSVVLSGLRKSPRKVRYAAGSANLLVHFTEGGAAAFFKDPVHKLFAQTLSMDNFVSASELSILEEQLAEAENNSGKIKTIESFLLSKLRNTPHDPLVQRAVEKIKNAKGNVRIEMLAAELNISQDPFEKRFRQTVGTTPKHFSTIVKLRNVIDHYRGGSLTDAALKAGYFDQAHFTKNFKTFTGQTPHDYFRSVSKW